MQFRLLYSILHTLDHGTPDVSSRIHLLLEKTVAILHIECSAYLLHVLCLPDHVSQGEGQVRGSGQTGQGAI